MPNRFRRMGSAAVLVYAVLATRGAAAHPSDTRARVSGHRITATSPAVTIDVDHDFQFVGRVPFVIDNIAAGERLVFAKTRGTRIDRLFVVQLESILPASDESYRYDIDHGVKIGAVPFRNSIFAYSSMEAANENPKGEAALMDAFLKARGYSVPDDWIVARFATVAGARRRDEMIVFYLRPLAATAYKRSELFSADGEQVTERGRLFGDELTREALAAFRVRLRR